MSNMDNGATQMIPALIEISREHDYFLDLLRDIKEACTAEVQNDPEEITLVITTLSEFFLEHFDKEEALMHELDYPELRQHKELHHEMSFHLRMLGDRVSKEHSGEMLYDFCGFFIDWLMQHDQLADAKLRAYARQQAPQERQ